MKIVRTGWPAYALLGAYALLVPLIYQYLAPLATGLTIIMLAAAAFALGTPRALLCALYAIFMSIMATGQSAGIIVVNGLAYLIVAGGISFFVSSCQLSRARLQEDIDRRKELEERLRFVSYHDGLTGAYNRTYLEEQLPLLDKHAKLPLSIIMGDVNGLKLINDTFGHHAGDQLLLQAAAIIGAHSRKKDLFCRWGGDEFLLILPGTDKMTALKITEKINQSCKASSQDPIAVSIALGVATKEKDMDNVQEILKEAEDRMYRNKLLESKNSRYTLVSSLQALMEEKTEETIGHALRMQGYAHKIGQKLGLSTAELDELALLSALHDIGKIAIPDNVIMKLDALTPTEWELMQKHSEIGHRIASASPELSHIADNILHHHEWWNGTGYPQGLMEDQIPLLARIIAITDSFDVMTHGRPYKVPLTKRQAVSELQRLRGTQYDPRLVDIFLEIVEEEEGRRQTNEGNEDPSPDPHP